MKKIIGITGSSGSGKTTVTKILEKELKAKAIYADEVVKQMQKPNSEYFEKIVDLFGYDILDKVDKGTVLLDKGTVLLSKISFFGQENRPLVQLNRKKIADIIFQNQEQKDRLDKLTYKYVVEEIKKQITTAEENYVIIDAPLLIESRLNEICDIVIGVVSEKKEQIKRICNRDNIEESKAILRLEAQKDNEFYKKNVDYIVENNGGNYDEFVGRIRKLVQKLQQM